MQIKFLRSILFIIAICVSFSAKAEHNLLLIGKSWHFHSSDQQKRPKGGFNQYNYGLGYEYRWKDSGWVVGGMTYHDSFFHQTFAGYGGYRFSYPLTEKLSLQANMRLGYAVGRITYGFIPLPTVGIQYDRVALELTYMPSGFKELHFQTIGAFVRIQF